MRRWPRVLDSSPPFLLLSLVHFLLLSLIAPPERSFAGTAPEFDRAARRMMRGDTGGARTEYLEFLERAPKDRLAPVALLALAGIDLAASRDTAAAIGWLDRIVSEHPTTPSAREAARRKGDCLAARKEWGAAGDAYSLALRMARQEIVGPSPDWLTAVTVSAAESYERAEQPDRMVATYEDALRGWPPPEVAGAALERIAAFRESHGEEAAAAAALARLILEFPSSEHLNAALARREMISKHEEIAWRPYEIYAAGTALVNSRDYAGALSNADEALAADPPPALKECLEYRKITLETTLAGDYIEGCRRLRSYLREHPDGLRSRMARETLEERWGPIAEMEKALAAEPNDLELLQNLGGTYLNARVGPKAVEILERARAIDPADAQTSLLLGYGYSMVGRGDEALQAFEHYLKTNPEDTTALNMIGYGLLGQGRAEEAIRYFEKYVELAPEDPNAHDSLGEGYMTAGRMEDAVREYERAVELNPGFANSLFMLGRIHQTAGEPARARSAFERFLLLTTSGPQAEEARAALQAIQNGSGKGEEN